MELCPRVSPRTRFAPPFPQNWRVRAIVFDVARATISRAGELGARASPPPPPSTMPSRRTTLEGMLSGGEEGCDLKLTPTPSTP